MSGDAIMASVASLVLVADFGLFRRSVATPKWLGCTREHKKMTIRDAKLLAIFSIFCTKMAFLVHFVGLENFRSD